MVVAPVVDAGGEVEAPPVRAAVLSVNASSVVEVLVGGKKYGRTPLELELSAGAHREVGGGKAFDVTLEPGDSRELYVQLAAPKPASQPVREGRLLLSATPYCLFTVDGRPASTVPVSERALTVPAGTRVVQCTFEDVSLARPRVKKRTVQVPAGGEVEAAFDMRAD